MDAFKKRGLRIFGPTKEAAQLESSKTFAKQVMKEAGVPTAAYEVLNSAEEAQAYLEKATTPVVLKANGLAAGKGVSVCEDLDSVESFIESVFEHGAYGDAGKQILVEEFMNGEEVSYFVIADGQDYIPLGSAQDHKRLDEGDQGPNTGGMGAYSPAPMHDRRN